MAYPCDLPANMGNTDILRAIYAKLSDINPSTGTIEQKLDIIQDQLAVANNNIEANTQAIKDISINVDIHSKDIQSITKAINKQTKAIENIQIHIDTSDLSDSVQLVAAKVEDGFVKTVEAIKSIQPGPTPPVPPRPVPPCPPPHPYPPHNDVIFYPVPLGLPAQKCFKNLVHNKLKPHYKRCEYKPKEPKYKCKTFVPLEARPNSPENFDPLHTPHNPNCPPFNSKKREYNPKIRYPKHF